MNLADAHRMVNPDMEDYFHTRAVVAAVVAGIIAVVGIFVLRADDAFLFQGLAERGWPLLLLSGVTGIAALIILRRGARHATRALGALAVASVIWGWGVAQYPYLLPQSLTISAGAGAPATLQWLVVVVVAALLLVVPSLLFVFRLDQQSRLEVNPLEIDMSQNGTVADSTVMPRVVIVGGGFAGVAVAKGLKNVSVRITLLDKTNYHLFQPLLYQVATGILEPGTISTPIRSLFRHQKNVDVRMAEVTSVDKERRIVHLDGGAESVPYDYLVLATGAHGSYFGHDDWAPLAPSMKTLADAEFLRRRIIGALERADRTSDPTVREQLLTFVLVGAGPTGCELAGSLAEHFRRIPAEYRNMDPRQAHIILVEAGPRALATFSEDLAAGAVAKLRSLGVDVRLGKAVEQVDEDGVIIAGERVATRTVLWTAGVAASPAGQWLDVESDRAGRVVVGTDLSITGYPEIFVVGDTAHIENDGKMLPGVAQVALQSGKHAAHSIRARVLHQPPPGPFAYFDKGNMATISFTYAIMEKDKVKMRGPLGKLAWTFIHILYLGRAEGQLMLCMQWLFGLVLGRPASRYIDTPSAEVVERVVSAVPEDAAGEVSV